MACLREGCAGVYFCTTLGMVFHSVADGVCDLVCQLHARGGLPFLLVFLGAGLESSGCVRRHKGVPARLSSCTALGAMFHAVADRVCVQVSPEQRNVLREVGEDDVPRAEAGRDNAWEGGERENNAQATLSSSLSSLLLLNQEENAANHFPAALWGATGFTPCSGCPGCESCGSQGVNPVAPRV